jgi:hypothetical protein
MLISFLRNSFFPKKRERGLFVSLSIDFAAIILWRGVWGLLDLYIFPENQQLSFIVSAFMGVSILLLIRKKYL